ncbi:hypothetical protein LRS13_11180 [Svornostia abyssi]|uniref:Uncharacterized protein n=1 Tax=Svornostia abyssi TaxID=2898438 RepID=A0ABY5PMV3_9ACTN|nr:hypothetical protein LRS13_11180 [Parviterribacteraceae bacterium J379]
MRRRPRLGCVVLAVVVLPAPPAGAQVADAATTSLRQDVTVAWRDGRAPGRDRESFAIPGIGSGEVVCRRDAAFIRMRPTDTAAETSMWSTLLQRKGGADVAAVHNARVYTFSTPTSQTARGTGPAAHEGLNQRRPLEDRGEGRAFGLISQRSARNVPAAGAVSPTSFTLQWRWTGFAGSARDARCRVTATFLTRLPAETPVRTVASGGLVRRPGPAVSALNLNWRGDADAAANLVSRPITLPYLGTLSATCPPGRGSRPALTLKADRADLGPAATVLTYEGEGPDAVTSTRYATDPGTGQLGPVPLPVNGMLRATITGSSRTVEVVASSIRKTNDPDGADNFCEIAVQAVSGAG